MNNLANLKNLVVMVVRGHIASVTDCPLAIRDPSDCASLGFNTQNLSHCAPLYRTGRPGIRGKCIGVEFSSCR